MSASLGLTVVVYAVALAAWAGTCAITGRLRQASFTVALVVLELGAVGQGLLDIVSLVGRVAGSDSATNLGYLLVSVAVLPVVAATVRLDPRRWASTGLALGCLLLAVVTVRLHQTMPAAHE